MQYIHDFYNVIYVRNCQCLKLHDMWHMLSLVPLQPIVRHHVVHQPVAPQLVASQRFIYDYSNVCMYVYEERCHLNSTIYDITPICTRLDEIHEDLELHHAGHMQVVYKARTARGSNL